MPKRDQRKLETQREVTRVLDNLMHKRPRQFAPRFPRMGLYVHCMESLETPDESASRGPGDDVGLAR